MDIYKIDYVVHAFIDNTDKENQCECFKVPIKWGEIWDIKGSESIDDPFILNGWEFTNFDPIKLIKLILLVLNISKDKSILEIGCGAGLLTSLLKEYNYIGTDKSCNLVCKNIKLTNNTIINFSAEDVLFKNNYFDYTIINSVLEYLPSIEVVEKSINEIERITKYGIYIANIRFKTRNALLEKHKYDGEFIHLVIDKEYFINKGYTILDSLYDTENRYDIYKKIT